MDQATEALLSGQPSSVTEPPPAAVPVVVPAEPISQTPALEPGKPIVAPDPSQAESNPGKTPTPAVSAPAAGEQANTAISDDQLLNAAGLTENPEQKLSRLERDHSASSKEARRLLDYTKSLEGILKDQGADIARDEQGNAVGLVANKKYSKDMKALDIKFKDLPEEVQAQIETDPQKAVDFIVDKAKKAMTRAAPTLERSAALPVSPERHESAVQYLAGMKWETGDTKFPGLAANRKLVEQMLNVPSAPKALKEFYNQEPEMALALLNLQLDHARSHVTERATKAAEALIAKKKAAEGNPQPLPSGGGVATLGGDAGDDLASQVINARQRY